MLELARVKKTDTIVDLGCGDGRIVVTAARKYGCKAIGYDLDRECLRRARERVRREQVQDRVQIIEEDIFNVDLRDVDVVTLYLFLTTNVKLVPQIEKMRPGSRIVSHAAGIKDVRADKVITVTSKDDEQEHKLYLWTVPLKKDAVTENDK
jgi:ribosomal protein L11 methylase PrmA